MFKFPWKINVIDKKKVDKLVKIKKKNLKNKH